ncbi:MAG TPA: arginase family protein, partial [Terriglobales bacterium]|nr:arginase family protein [Terriglobales bacterium]
LPIYSLSEYHGMALAVKSLRTAGIDRILASHAESFHDLGDVQTSMLVSNTGPRNLKNFPEFLKDTDSLEKSAGKVDSADFAFCLGGGCELIIGTLAGFKRAFKGKPGVVWMDAHGDFNTPETSASGYIGGMGLAMACGRGPRFSSRIEDARPLLMEENVVHIDSRTVDPLEQQAMINSRMKLYSAETVRAEGAAKIAEDTANYLVDKCDWIVCHLDVDALDPMFNSGVNFPASGGLNPTDVKTIVGALQRTGKMRVFNLTAYNPLFDEDGRSCKTLLSLVTELFS